MDKNQKYIIRTDRAGVFYAGISDRRGSEADLTDARRIYSWRGAATCSQISMDGVAAQSQLTQAVPAMTVLGVIEILPCSAKSVEVLDKVPVWKL